MGLGLGLRWLRYAAKVDLTKNPKSPFKDISNTIGIGTKVRPKSGKSPKTNTNEESIAARIKKHDLKRSLPPHDEADTQSQKKRAVTPHVLLSPENILAVAVPQPCHSQ